MWHVRHLGRIYTAREPRSCSVVGGNLGLGGWGRRKRAPRRARHGPIGPAASATGRRPRRPTGQELGLAGLVGQPRVRPAAVSAAPTAAGGGPARTAAMKQGGSGRRGGPARAAAPGGAPAPNPPPFARRLPWLGPQPGARGTPPPPARPSNGPSPEPNRTSPPYKGRTSVSSRPAGRAQDETELRPDIGGEPRFRSGLPAGGATRAAATPRKPTPSSPQFTRSAEPTPPGILNQRRRCFPTAARTHRPDSAPGPGHRRPRAPNPERDRALARSEPGPYTVRA
jgi:hypothetical protein